MRFLYLLIFCGFSKLYALPTEMVEVHGNVQIAPSLSDQLILQTGEKTILNWKDFSIQGTELVHFEQPSQQAVVLNRVTGTDSSSIMGQLTSNGKVFLVNPMGIVIGSEASIRTAGFIASTFDVLDAEVLNQKEYHFFGDSNATILQQGSIECLKGDILLAARSVQNEGTLLANEGYTAVAAGYDILFKPEGTQRVFVRCASVNTDDELRSVKLTQIYLWIDLDVNFLLHRGSFVTQDICITRAASSTG